MSDWLSARRLLCIRLDNLGDVLMTTPALRALKAQRPDRELTLLASRAAAGCATHIPEVDAVIPYDAPWVSHEGDAGLSADERLVERLRQENFDGAIIFTVYSQSALPAALLCRYAGIPLRLAHARENPYRLLSHWQRDPEPAGGIRHEVRRQLDLVASIGARCEDETLSFTLRLADRSRVAGLLATRGVDPHKPWILLHPGATAASRRYPAPGFAIAARLLHQQLGLPLVFGGTPAERPLVEQIRGLMHAPSHSLAGELNLGECAAAIAAASLLIGNNSGPVHLAAALGTPVVDLYALTNPQHTPWLVPHRLLFRDVPCKYCYRSVCPQGHQRCLRGVTPRQILGAAQELLQVVPPPLAAANGVAA